MLPPTFSRGAVLVSLKHWPRSRSFWSWPSPCCGWARRSGRTSVWFSSRCLLPRLGHYNLGREIQGPSRLCARCLKHSHSRNDNSSATIIPVLLCQLIFPIYSIFFSFLKIESSWSINLCVCYTMLYLRLIFFIFFCLNNFIYNFRSFVFSYIFLKYDT